MWQPPWWPELQLDLEPIWNLNLKICRKLIWLKCVILYSKKNMKLGQTERPNWRSGFIITGTEERKPSWNWGMERGSMRDLRLGGGNKGSCQRLLFCFFPEIHVIIILQSHLYTFHKWIVHSNSIDTMLSLWCYHVIMMPHYVQHQI